MLFDGKILENTFVSKDTFLLRIEKPAEFKSRPAQFVELKLEGKYPLLRRPISIYSEDENSLSLLIKVVGELTEKLTTLKKGDVISVLGPLGTCFEKKTDQPILLVGGGIGVAPVSYFAEELNREGIPYETFLGFKEEVVGTDAFHKKTLTIHLEKERPGFIIEELQERIEKDSNVSIYACGPTPLLKAIQKLANEKGIEAYLSLEERMACGVGACVGCSVKVKRGEDFVYKRVCKDGPVFLASEVMYE
ncbi:dihydroorotate dehydrogenase electron transfer subunit [Guggenheimella bovis]